MSVNTLNLIAARYDNQNSAIADYHAVESLYKNLNLMDTYDAAVITRTDKGKVKIVERHEQTVRQGAGKGLAIGLATGAVAAMFPAVALGAGLLYVCRGGGNRYSRRPHLFSAVLSRARPRPLRHKPVQPVS